MKRQDFCVTHGTKENRKNGQTKKPVFLILCGQELLAGMLQELPKFMRQHRKTTKTYRKYVKL